MVECKNRDKQRIGGKHRNRVIAGIFRSDIAHCGGIGLVVIVRLAPRPVAQRERRDQITFAPGCGIGARQPCSLVGQLAQRLALFGVLAKIDRRPRNQRFAPAAHCASRIEPR